MTTDALVAQHRRRLFGLAYRMLGQVGEAEDAVQEAFLRWSQTDQETIENPAGWLTTVVTRICLDRLRSAQRKRETYVGPWLPEPLLTDEADPADAADRADSLTLAFLVVLESLSPAERAAFLLHDVFGYEHEAVAGMLDRAPTAVRQLVSRARRHLADRRPRYEEDADRRREVAEAFMTACTTGDLDGLMTLLAPDVVWLADGGGVASATRRPVVGADEVARVVLGLMRLVDASWDLRPAQVNGMPGVLGFHNGRLETVIALHVTGAVISAIHAVRNPEKLRALRLT